MSKMSKIRVSVEGYGSWQPGGIGNAVKPNPENLENPGNPA